MAVDKAVDSAVLDGYFDDIADSIRTKAGTQSTYTPAQMSSAIDDIPSGDLSEYFNDTITATSGSNYGWVNLIKKFKSPISVSNGLTDWSYMFYKSPFVPEISTSSSNVTNMNYMFAYTDIINAPSLDTSNVTSMYEMFYRCENLVNVPLYNTSNATNMSEMFAYCFHLEGVPLFNTSNTTNFTRMFQQCYELKNVPNLDTSNATTIEAMFSSCQLLTSIPQMSTSNVKNFASLCYACNNLTTVPLLDTSSACYSYSFQSTFYNCSKLSDDSLNNILKMCANATLYPGTKTLVQLGFQSRHYPASRIQALSNYNDFVNAGWTIGWS